MAAPYSRFINMHLMFEEGQQRLVSNLDPAGSQLRCIRSLALVRLASSRRVWVRPQSALWRTDKAEQPHQRRDERATDGKRNCRYCVRAVSGEVA